MQVLAYGLEIFTCSLNLRESRVKWTLQKNERAETDDPPRRSLRHSLGVIAIVIPSPLSRLGNHVDHYGLAVFDDFNRFVQCRSELFGFNDWTEPVHM